MDEGVGKRADVDAWLKVADEDFEVARLAFEHGRYVHAGFCCRQAVSRLGWAA